MDKNIAFLYLLMHEKRRTIQMYVRNIVIGGVVRIVDITTVTLFLPISTLLFEDFGRSFLYIYWPLAEPVAGGLTFRGPHG